MVKVTSDSIPWLTKGTPGYSVFSDPPKQPPVPKYVLASMTAVDGIQASPQRRSASRATEIFIGAGCEVRCIDLRNLKARYDAKSKDGKSQEGADKFATESPVHGTEYQTLNIPELDFEINQLEISPDGNYLAIVGEKRLGVCMLPTVGFARLGVEKLRAKYHHVGTAYHNENSDRIVRALWHPFGVDGASLIVLTSDAFIRVYDFTMHHEHTIEQPDQTFDLSALSGQERQKTSFTPDPEAFEPASCYFGSGDQGWRPFTLYILMRGGDIYALCPIVPSRWRANPEYLNSLALEISTRLETLTDSLEATISDRLMLRQQTKWVNEVLEQHSTIAQGNQMAFNGGGRKRQDWLTRPESVGPTPLLQGPFLLQPAPTDESAEEVYACDIMHISSDPVAILATTWSSGKIDICLEFEPLMAKWVGKKPRHKQIERENQLPIIAAFETIALNILLPSDSARQSWPLFAENPLVNETFFVAHYAGIEAVDMSGWLNQLRTVLDLDEADTFIANNLRRTQGSSVTKVVNSGETLPASPHPIVGCVVLQDSYIGYVLICNSPTKIYTADFDIPIERHYPDESQYQPSMVADGRRKQGQNLPGYVASIAQPLYDPSQFLQEPPSLMPFAHDQRRRNPQLMSGQIQYNAETLEILRQAREQIKREYEKLMTVAEAICNRARLQSIEYQRQVTKVNELFTKHQNIRNANLEKRLEESLKKQQELTTRADAVIRQLVVQGLGASGEGAASKVSQKEKEWFAEIRKVKQRLEAQGGLIKRKEKVENIIDELAPLVETQASGSATEDVDDGVPKGLREKKLKELNELLTKEEILVNSTKEKVGKLEVRCEELGL